MLIDDIGVVSELPQMFIGGGIGVISGFVACRIVVAWKDRYIVWRRSKISKARRDQIVNGMDRLLDDIKRYKTDWLMSDNPFMSESDDYGSYDSESDKLAPFTGSSSNDIDSQYRTRRDLIREDMATLHGFRDLLQSITNAPEISIPRKFPMRIRQSAVDNMKLIETIDLDDGEIPTGRACTMDEYVSSCNASGKHPKFFPPTPGQKF